MAADAKIDRLTTSQGGSESKSDSFTRKDVSYFHGSLPSCANATSAPQLRDIFTIHPNTACHTHELLECPCDEGTGGLTATEEESRRSASTGDDEDDSDSERGFIQASAVRREDIEKM